MATPTNRVLWLSLISSQLAYVVVSGLVSLGRDDDGVLGVLVPGFVILSLATGAATIVLRRRALVEPIRAGHLDPTNPEHQQRAFTPWILCLALSESIGLWGLVLALLSGETRYCMVFVAAAIALLFVHRPDSPDFVPPMGGIHTPPPIG